MGDGSGSSNLIRRLTKLEYCPNIRQSLTPSMAQRGLWILQPATNTSKQSRQLSPGRPFTLEKSTQKSFFSHKARFSKCTLEPNSFCRLPPEIQMTVKHRFSSIFILPLRISSLGDSHEFTLICSKVLK